MALQGDFKWEAGEVWRRWRGKWDGGGRVFAQRPRKRKTYPLKILLYVHGVKAR